MPLRELKCVRYLFDYILQVGLVCGAQYLEKLYPFKGMCSRAWIGQ